MKETIKMIKNTVKELLNGQMEENILGNGAKENNTVKEFTSKKERRDSVFGKWVREQSGSKINNPIIIHELIILNKFSKTNFLLTQNYIINKFKKKYYKFLFRSYFLNQI